MARRWRRGGMKVAQGWHESGFGAAFSYLRDVDLNGDDFAAALDDELS